MKIIKDDLTDPQVIALLEEHMRDMQATSPPESVHALDIEKLRNSKVIFWSIWDDENLAGCGAYIELDPTHIEIKSMRTSKIYKNKGIASAILQHIINEAKNKGYARLSLETGSMDYFEPARRLYLKHGFEYTTPFSNYSDDPNSRFLTRML
jgi:putative acetyltransferase